MRGDDKRQIFSALGMAASFGFNMAASVAVGLVLGRYLDDKLDWYPWATIVGIVFGMITGLWSIYKRVMREHLKG